MNKITSSWPRAETENYIEIVDLLAIDRAFKERNMVLVSGVAGSGKTTLAIKYAKLQSETGVVVWFAAESARKIDDRLQRILADDLKLDPARLAEMQERARVEAVVEHVKGTTTPHLFVFDDIGREGMHTVRYFSDSSSLPTNLRLLLTSSSGDLKEDSTVKVVKMEPVQASQAEKYFLSSLDFRHDGFSRRIFDEAIRTAVDLTPYRLQTTVAFLQLHVDKNKGIDSSDLDKMIDRLKRKDVSKCLLNGLEDHAECRSLLDVARYLDTDALAVELVTWIGLAATDTLKRYRVVSEFVLDNQKYLRVHRLLVEAANERADDSIDKKVNGIVSICLQKLAGIDKVTEESKRRALALQNQLAKLLETGKNVLDLYDPLIMIEEKHTRNYRRAVELLEELKSLWLAKEFSEVEVVKVLKRLCKLYETMGNVSAADKVRKEIEKMRKSVESEGNRRFADFKFMALIKDTGHSKIYQARDLRENTNVAIKVVKSGTLELNKIEIIQDARPPFVVQFLGNFKMKENLFVVMEFCQPGDLRTMIDLHAEKKSGLSDKEWIGYVENWSWELMFVLTFMKKYNIVHNDFKPENILIDAKMKSIKVTDFGEAQHVNDNRTVSIKGGTLAYMAPERMHSSGQKESASAASDLWSCGIIFYELIYLKRQFESDRQWLDRKAIFHDTSKLGVRFKPIFEGIFREKPEERLPPEHIILMIKDEAPKQFTGDQYKGAKMVGLTDSCRIQNRLPIDDDAVNRGPRIDRHELAEKIKEKLDQKSVVVLEGPLGAGKSDLAAEIARTYGDKEVVVVWVNAASPSCVDGELQHILLRDLELDSTKAARMDESARVAAIHKHVKNEDKPHLFILANVQEAAKSAIDALMRAIPANLKLLVTTAVEKLKTQQRVERINVDPIDRTQAEKYFRESLGAEAESGTMRRVLDELFKSGRKWTPGELRTAVATTKVFLDRTEDGEDPRRVDELIRALAKANISDATLGMLKQDAGCQRLLELARFLETDEIAFELLALLFDDYDALSKALKQLKHYQIVSEFSINERKFVKMDKMLVEAVRRDGKPDEAARKRVIGVFIARLAGIDEVTTENRRLVPIMRNHVFKLIGDKKLQANEEVFSLYERLIVIEKKYTFSLLSARDLGRTLLELKRTFYKGKPGEASVAASLNELSDTLMSLGEFAEVIRLQSAALAEYKKVHKNAANEQTMRCLNSLGLAHAAAGNHQEAIAKHTEALEMNRKLNGAASDHPDTATSLNNLAASYEAAGRLTDAFSLYYEALEMYKRFYSERPNHRTIAHTLSNLAAAYTKTETHTEALRLYKESLRVYKKVGDEKDSTIAASMTSLALAYRSLGQFSKAIELLTEALKMYRKIHRDEPNHEDVLVAVGRLATVQESAGNYKEALKHLESLLEIYQQISAPKNQTDVCSENISRLKTLIEKQPKS